MTYEIFTSNGISNGSLCQVIRFCNKQIAILMSEECQKKDEHTNFQNKNKNSLNFHLNLLALRPNHSINLLYKWKTAIGKNFI